MSPQQAAALQKLSARVIAAYNEANQILMGRRCKVKRARFHGKVYHNREGIIDGVHIDSERGIMPLVYILRDDGSGAYLNSEPATRQCWRLDELDIT